MKKIILTGLVIATAISLTGCAGNGGPSFQQVGTKDGKLTEVTKEQVELKTKMTETIFLEPVSPNEQIVFLKIRNTSDNDLSNLQSIIKMNLQKIGWTTTANPRQANFMIQANIIMADRVKENGKLEGMTAGLAVAGAGVGAYNNNGSSRDAAGAALIAGLIGAAIESAEVKPVRYAMVTDVEIRQRPLDGETVTQEDANSHKQGTGNYTSQKSTNTNVKWKKYRTKIISEAKGAGLEFKQVRKLFSQELSKSIINML